ncbi:MAG: histidine kinase [Firmicutes bacterium]|nr:histidine kinase [Bacillota bacterium]
MYATAIVIALTIAQFGVFIAFDLEVDTALKLGGALFLINLSLLLILRVGPAEIRSWLSARKKKSERRESQANKTLQIAYETLPFMRQGLNQSTAQKTAEIIKKISDVAAVAITDREKVLAFIGAGCEQHKPGDEIMTEATKKCLATSTTQIITNQRDLNCPRKDCDCPLDGAVIVPLKCRKEVVGTLKLYEKEAGGPPEYIIKLAEGIGQLLNMQIELAELDRQAQLTTMAELDALRAQINPHFLFNTLNTIIMYSRVEPSKAREMLIKLSDFFRLALKKPGHLHTFKDELKFVQNYLYLEEHRFKDRLQVKYEISPEVADIPFPVLTLQPLVENAIRHGLSPKIGPGELTIEAALEGSILRVRVVDDGVGMDEMTRMKALLPGQGSGFGVGLSNVYERLKRIYGSELHFEIISAKGAGTTIEMALPWEKALQFAREVDYDPTGTDS